MPRLQSADHLFGLSFNMSKLVFLLFGLVAASLAAPSDESLESEELESVELIYEEDDEVRGFLQNGKGNNRCTCSAGNSCGCCARPHIPMVGKFEGCLNATILTEEKQIDVKIVANGKSIISKKVSIAATERICDRLPGALDGIKICLYTTTTDLEDKSGIQFCPKVDVMKGTKIVSKITFACAQFKDEKLSLNDNGEVKAKDLFKIKKGNAWKGFLNMIGAREPSHKE